MWSTWPCNNHLGLFSTARRRDHTHRKDSGFCESFEDSPRPSSHEFHKRRSASEGPPGTPPTPPPRPRHTMMTSISGVSSRPLPPLPASLPWVSSWRRHSHIDTFISCQRQKAFLYILFTDPWRISLITAHHELMRNGNVIGDRMEAEFFNLRSFKFSQRFYKNRILQCMGEIFCAEWIMLRIHWDLKI